LLFVISALIIGFDELVIVTLGRGLNVYLDFELLRSAWDLSLSNLGTITTFTAIAAGVLLVTGLIFLIGQLLDGLATHPRSTNPWLAMVTLGGGLLLLIVPTIRFTTSAGVDSLRHQATQVLLTRSAHENFRQQMADTANTTQPVPLAALENRDVLLVFIESYGRQALDDPAYAPMIEQRLETMAATLARANLGVVSGLVQAPIQGGQSWLSHGSLLSGEWLNNQLDYEGMLDSGIPTLIADFNATGHHTVAIMPANTREWLPGNQLGFDTVFDATNMGYAGPAFNFVTMPDQYTLHWFDHAVRQPSHAPVFAEIALISSHAPWVPVLPLLNWDELAGGGAYAQYTEGHPTPETVFSDNALVRDYYLRALDYTLAVVTEYAARYLGPDDLLMVVGDHEAPPLVTQTAVTRAVPIHIISGQSALLAPWLARAGGWRTG
ncbi:MAG: alkaline phosphatase, partial [Natronospirillum sp.]